MSKSTISTFELFAMYPDQESARTYLEGRLWPEGPKCPVCGLGERITARAGGFSKDLSWVLPRSSGIGFLPSSQMYSSLYFVMVLLFGVKRITTQRNARAYGIKTP